MWKHVVRPLLFCLPAERAHEWSMTLFALGAQLPGMPQVLLRQWMVSDPRLQTTLWGLTFRNPIGLAAGFDKNARWLQPLSCLGFGSIEIGSVTGTGQAGNPRPRLFRLVGDQAVINRMGFNNLGADAVARRLAATSPAVRDRCVLGVNVGKTKTVPLEQAADDYEHSFRALFPYADYFVVNVSSPNTPGLRTLQEREPLERLLTRLDTVNSELGSARRRPVLLKIAPDLNDDQLQEIAALARTPIVDGLIAVNTTIHRGGLQTDPRRVEQIGPGGLSGRPLYARSCQVISLLSEWLRGEKPIIGVGGVFSGRDAWNMLCLGASLVQVYTGIVYEGPGLIGRINRWLVEQLDRRGLQSIAEVVGRRELSESGDRP